MEYVECDRCGKRYTDQASIKLSKRSEQDWAKGCREDGVEPRGLIGCPLMPCDGEMVLKHGRIRPSTQQEVLARYPRLVGHLICCSLGYFTPGAAANAVVAHIRGESNGCEWYTHMAQGWDTDKLLQVGRETLASAFRQRHHHQGYMSEYRQAKALVDHVRQGGQGPVFASWF